MALRSGFFIAVIVGSALLSALVPAFAADPSAVAAPAVKPVEEGWIVTLDANVSLGSDYPGASTRHVQYLPGLSFRRAGEKAGFSSPDDGLDLAVFDAGWLKAGPVAKLMGSRRSNSNPELIGLRQVDRTLEAGAFVEYWPMENLRARVEVRQGVSGHRGLLATLATDVVVPIDKLTLSGGPRMNFGNGQFVREYFSITPAQALANGRVTPFDARGGLYSIGALSAASYEFSTTWTGTVWGAYQRLVGDAGRSPIPRVLGSRNEGSFGLTISYSFNTKGF